MKITTLIKTCLIVIALVGDLQAQEPKYGETVTTRHRPAFDPPGIRAGGFLVYPKVTIGEEYNDNVFARTDNKESDFITLIRPSVEVKSDWNNHALGFAAKADISRYAQNTNEDYEDFTLGGKGRLDITRNQNLFAGASYVRLHEARGSPDDVGGITQTEYETLSILGGYEHRFNRLALRLEGEGIRYRFNNVDNAAGNPIPQDVRDRDEVVGTLRASYELTPNYKAFLEGSYNVRTYDGRQKAFEGFTRDSKGYAVVIGTDLDLTGVTFGEVYVGYSAQHYDDPSLSTVDGPTAGGKIYWNVTGLTTVTASIDRTITETTFVTNSVPGQIAPEIASSAYYLTRYGVVVDHELLRNLLLQLSLFGIEEDFRGINRTDNIFLGAFGATYMMNRYVDVSVDYTYQNRDSDVRSFTQNVAMLRLTLKL